MTAAAAFSAVMGTSRGSQVSAPHRLDAQPAVCAYCEDVSEHEQELLACPTSSQGALFGSGPRCAECFALDFFKCYLCAWTDTLKNRDDLIADEFGQAYLDQVRVDDAAAGDSLCFVCEQGDIR